MDNQEILWEHILIQITRILDAPKRSQQKRATLKTLRDALSAELKQKVTNRLEMISQHAAFCWDWRNRYVAHRDHALALEKITNALLLGSPGDVEKILEGMAELLNLVREHYGMHPVAFDAPPPHQGVQKPLRTLQLGLMMKERRNAQMDRGEEPDGGFALPLV